MVSEAVHKQQLAQLAAVGAGLSAASGSANGSSAFTELGSFAESSFNTNPNRTAAANATDYCSMNETERATFKKEQEAAAESGSSAGDRDYSETEYPDLTDDIVRAQSVLTATQNLSPDEQAAIPIAFNWNPADIPTYDDDHPDGTKIEEPFTDTEDGEELFPVVEFGICSPGSYIPDWARIIQVILKGIFKIVHAIISRICSFDVEVLGNGGNLRFVCLPMDLILIALEAIVSNMNVCNDMVTGYYNAAAIERAHHIHDYDMSALLQQTTCWPTPVSLGVAAACNGADDDCNGLVDELAEDKFAPTIRLQLGCSAATGVWFTSPAAATVCIHNRLVVEDDCRGTVVPSIAITSACALSSGTISAQDAAGNPSSLVVPLQIDGIAPVLTASVGLTVLVSNSANFQDVLLAYTAVDNCGKPISVKVEVFSDEFDPSAPKDAIFYTKPSGATAVMLRNKAASSCSGSTAICVSGSSADGRVYHIVVSATDVVGNTVSAPALLVQARRAPNTPAIDGGPRWLLAEKTIVQP